MLNNKARGHGGFLRCMGVLLASIMPTAAFAVPVAKILSPVAGAKLHATRPLEVTIDVSGTGTTQSRWSLTLLAPGKEVQVAEGSGDASNLAVAVLRHSEVPSGVPLQLSLSLDGTVRASVSFLAVANRYAAIPFDATAVSRYLGWSVDTTGRYIATSGVPGNRGFDLLDRDTFSLQSVSVDIGSSEGHKLTAIGNRYFFKGSFRDSNGIFALGFGYYDFASGESHLIDAFGNELFGTNASGTRAIYQASVRDPSGAGFTRQYILWDEASGERRQITDAADAIIYPSDSEACPRLLGTTPVMSADGSRAVFFTHSTLGNAADDPTIGCRVFIYDVADDTLALAAAIPREKALGLPSLSADGRWLAFTSAYIRPPHTAAGSYAALLDLETGALTDPVGGIVDSPSFDSVITGDRDAVVVSTTADLDPRVGNADHNFELFLYDNASGEFTQISETTGGAGLGGNGCQQRRPAVDHDGSVVVWAWDRMSAESCVIDGPQRNEADGLHLGRVRAIRKRPGNHAPEWSLPRTARVRAGDTLDLDVSASDADGDFLTFFAQVPDTVDVPAGSTFTDHRNGTATLHWPTKPADAGVHTLRVAVFDEGGDEQFGDVQIAVCSEILHDGNLLGVLWALFDPDPPVPCRDADLNGDGVVSAADLVAALRAG